MLGLTLLLPFALGLRAHVVDTKLGTMECSTALSELTQDDHAVLAEACVHALSLRWRGPGREDGSGCLALSAVIHHATMLLQRLHRVRRQYGTRSSISASTDRSLTHDTTLPPTCSLACLWLRHISSGSLCTRTLLV